MNPSPKPILIYDGRCAFCLMWIDRWKRITLDSVEYVSSSEYASSRRESSAHTPVPAEEYTNSVILLLPDGSYLTGANAVLTAIGSSRAGRILLFLHEKWSLFREAAGGLYRTVAGHRDEAYLLSRVLWGKSVVPPGFAVTRWLVLRGIAVVYLVAFASLLTQVRGLVGAGGISPVEMFLGAVYAQMGGSGPLYYPTLAWLNPGDGFLTGLCLAGLLASGMLLLGLVPRVSAFLCWLLYFSLVVAGQLFLQFQWDILLLEAGFLAVFFAPGGLVRFLPDAVQPPHAVRWLLWLLVFRLMFMSGVGKLAAGDPNWWNLSALSYHYLTECLPNPVAWYAYRLPLRFHEASAFLMFTIEIGAPLLIFTPRRLRHLGAFLLIGLQLLIMLTGNFAFFNLLSIVLCVALLDDGVTSHFVPRTLLKKAAPPPGSVAVSPESPRRLRRALTVTFVSLMVILNVNQVAGLVVPRSWWPSPVASLSAWAAHFHVVNGYGLFRVMTTKRPEIVIEGSDDRTHWKPYEFRYKPGNVTKPLPWVAPFQPRLDWQMWFAALGDYRSNGWLTNLAIRLMEGSPEVLSLMGDNPFPEHPPAYIRALLYEYRYATPGERDSTGAVWTRSLNSLYMPPISLNGN
jgi:predicted DCC family thiol-disulfide oxidoreductase YuxK